MPLAFIGSRRLLYLHVPKTGGTSVERTISQMGQMTHKNFFVPDGFPCTAQHWHGAVWEKLIPEASFFDAVFMTVRHPLRRFESEYRYRLASEIVSLKKDPKDIRVRLDGFSRWGDKVLDAYGEDPFAFDNHFRPQYEFEAFSPRVFRIEDGVDSISSFLARQLSLSTVPVIGKHKVSPYFVKTLWSRTLFDRVLALYAEDFKRYGYSEDISVEWLSA
jgi:hypothetical protein